MGGVGRVSHRNITLNPSVIKESNCTMESESEAEKIERQKANTGGIRKRQIKTKTERKAKRKRERSILVQCTFLNDEVTVGK